MSGVDTPSDFRDWVDVQPVPNWPLMPLTHITKSFSAREIIRSGKVSPSEPSGLDAPLAYFFYGRPAYRVAGDGAVKMAAACPFCFIFDPEVIERANGVHAFDTGAFAKRMYKHVMLDEMKVSDFSLGADTSRPNKLIASTFGDREAYFDGNPSVAARNSGGAPEWNFLAQSYLQLVASRGRNEPDDRVGSIEVVFRDPVLLNDNLKAVIVPHTIWSGNDPAPWLTDLAARRVEILPYKFIPGKSPEHYFTLIESEVRQLFRDWGHI